MKPQFKEDQIVIFKQRKGRHEHQPAWSYEDGNIIYIDNDKKECSIIWLEGYKSRTDDVPFEDIVAIVDTHIKEQTKIGSFTGHFCLLTAEIEEEPRHSKKR